MADKLMNHKGHWDRVHVTRIPEKLGWYQPRLETSLALIAALELDLGAPIIDVGGGASTLVDDLIDLGYEALAVLDISESALEISRKRLGRQADLVMWLSVDITRCPLPRHGFALWHDRAMLHFLIEPDQQQAYRNNLLHALQPGGHAIIATFAPDAPAKCGGLPVQRYTETELAALLGDEFELRQHQRAVHQTPGGIVQPYSYCLFRRL